MTRQSVSLLERAVLSGHVTIRAHAPDWVYDRATLEMGQVLHEDHNAIQTTGIAYILAMLLADPMLEPRQYGITQIELLDVTPSTRAKLDLTDQYVSGSSIFNVLYLTSIQGNAAPNLATAKLWLDAGGLTLLALNSFTPFQKTSSLALTVQWTVNLTGV